MSSQNTPNIYEVFKPLHVASQFTGLCSFSLQNQKGIHVSKVIFSNVLCLTLPTMWMAIVAILFYINYDEMLTVGKYYISEIFQQSIFWIILSFFINGIVLNLWAFAKRKQLVTFLNLLYEVDENLNALKFSVNLRSHKKIVLGFVVFMLATVGICVTTLIPEFNEYYQTNFILSISLLHCLSLTIFEIFHFTFWIFLVKERFKKVNFFLKQSFLTNCDQSENEGNNKLRIASKLYDKLVDISEYINHYYGFPVRYLKTSFKDYVYQSMCLNSSCCKQPQALRT